MPSRGSRSTEAAAGGARSHAGWSAYPVGAARVSLFRESLDRPDLLHELGSAALAMILRLHFGQVRSGWYTVKRGLYSW
jgi:hypothetical protein